VTAFVMKGVEFPVSAASFICVIVRSDAEVE